MDTRKFSPIPYWHIKLYKRFSFTSYVFYFLRFFNFLVLSPYHIYSSLFRIYQTFVLSSWAFFCTRPNKWQSLLFRPPSWSEFTNLQYTLDLLSLSYDSSDIYMRYNSICSFTLLLHLPCAINFLGIMKLFFILFKIVIYIGCGRTNEAGVIKKVIVVYREKRSLFLNWTVGTYRLRIMKF